MIIKYNDFLNEKLSDKLSGFNEEGLKQQFLKGKINLDNYFNICRKYNLEFPTQEEIFKKLKSSRYTPINLFVKSSEYGCLKGIKLAIEKGFNLKDHLKRVLHDAVSHDYNDIIKFIFDNYNIPTVDLNFSFQLLVNHENIEILKYFINKKIKIDEHTLKHTLYDASTNTYNIEIVKLLISMGAKVYEYIIDECYDVDIKELLQKYYDKQND
jgi:hypothetical protein